MDKHFLPEWLEKYPVFGLEMKLAWRRFKRGRFTRQFVFQDSDGLFIRMFKTAFVTALTIIVLSSFILSLSYQKRLPDLFDLRSYNFIHFWLVPISAILFTGIPALCGVSAFGFTGRDSSLGLLITSGIRAHRLVLEIMITRLLKYCLIAMALALMLYLIVLIPCSFASGEYPYRHPIFLFAAFFLLQCCIFLISGVFGATRLDFINKCFIILGFWLIVALIPSLVVSWANVCFLDTYQIGNISSVVFPIGSIYTYAEWACDYASEYEPSQYYPVLACTLSCVMMQILYSYWAIKLACRLFARRLSE